MILKICIPVRSYQFGDILQRPPTGYTTNQILALDLTHVPTENKINPAVQKNLSLKYTLKLISINSF